MTYADFILIIEYIALCFCVLVGFAVSFFVLYILVKLFSKNEEYNKWDKNKHK